MTVQEAAYKFGIKEYITSEGDTLHSIVTYLYKDFSDVYYMVLKKLNLRFDWYSLPAGVPIRYLSKVACKSVYELPSISIVPDKVSRRISSYVSYNDLISQSIYSQDEPAER